MCAKWLDSSIIIMFVSSLFFFSSLIETKWKEINILWIMSLVCILFTFKRKWVSGWLVSLLLALSVNCFYLIKDIIGSHIEILIIFVFSLSYLINCLLPFKRHPWWCMCVSIIYSETVVWWMLLFLFLSLFFVNCFSTKNFDFILWIFKCWND